MDKKKLISGALALTLLAGCSGGGTVTADPDDLAFQTADIQRDREIMTVDGVGVPAEEYLFWLVNDIENARYYGYLADDADWGEETFPDGTKLVEMAKEDALEGCIIYQVMRNKAAEYGVALTQEDKAQLATDLAAMVVQMGGQEAYQERLDAFCISAGGYSAIQEVGLLAEKVRDHLAEEGLLTVTEAEREAWVEENGVYATKHILISTRHRNEDGSYEDFSDEEKAQALAFAQGLREQLRLAGESEALFDELMAQYSEDGRDADGNLYAPDGYGFVTPGQMVPEFEAGALALEVGGISEPIETSYGYHIILRMEPDRETLEEQVGEEYKYSQLLMQWQQQAQVVTTKALDQLDPQDFYSRLQAVNEARHAAKADDETPVESPAET